MVQPVLGICLLGATISLLGQDFRMQEIGASLGVVYAVTTADVNGDGKRDVVAITNHQLLWFENPGWQRHLIAENVTEKDNVAIAPNDIDGDGRLDFALAADWQSTNTTGGGSLHWVSSSGKVTLIAKEPTLHRIGWADVDHDGKQELIAVPLHGRGTKAPDWQGAGARILIFRIPKNPAVDPWPVEVASEQLHIVHNFIARDGDLWLAASEGLMRLHRNSDGTWKTSQLGEGQPGEVKAGTVKGIRYIAAIEPWHGNKLVVYRETPGLWKREVLTDALQQGHALGWADLDGNGSDELIVGWRGKPWGLAVFELGAAGTWAQKAMVDDGVAVEDLTIADLNGDGKPEIVAGGRATGNLRIYWNQSPVSKPAGSMRQ